ncbi:hypothetical protein RvY_06914 [Ramazzottius varieornatus]|uniref:Uncharacterized protein n=1 Tax=Ramazzottius varieornatus TaxID=947166 RepID=A0A1D1V9T9_RAMVA|nr:hypothetical protein RvY_06914 [Ramazzottius varieornatus]
MSTVVTKKHDNSGWQTDGDAARLSHLTLPSVLFGGHICRVRERKEKASAGDKWKEAKLKSLQEYKNMWRKDFPCKVDLEKKYSSQT